MTWLRELTYRLRHLFKRDIAEQEFAEEVQSHIEIQTEEYLGQGLSPEKARRAARLKFGNVTLAKEDSRESWGFIWLDRLGQDLRYGARILSQSPGFTAVAVLSLAIGIGANTTIFSVVNAALLRPPPFEDPDRLVVLERISLGDGRSLPFSESVTSELREHAGALEHVSSAYAWSSPSLYSIAGETRRLYSRAVGKDLFRVLGVHPILGRHFDKPIADGGGYIISHDLWQRAYGGKADVLGKEIGNLASGIRPILGVMPAGFGVSPNANTDLWKADDTWYSRTQPIARLRRGVTAEQAQAEVDVIAANAEQDAIERETETRYEVLTLRQNASRIYGGPLKLLAGAVGFVLLIGCVNVAILMLARSQRRKKEIATRVALGAVSGRLFRQLMTESILLAGLGGIAGVWVAYAGIRLFLFLSSVWPAPADEITIDLTVLAYAFGVALLTGTLFGLAPALKSSRLDVNVALKERARGGAGDSRRRLQRVLATAEVAICIPLLVGAGLMINSFMRYVTADRGFRPEGLLTMSVELRGPAYEEIQIGNRSKPKPTAIDFHRRLLERLRALPGVQSVGMNPRVVPGFTSRMPFRIVGKQEPASDSEWRACYNEVNTDFFKTLEVPLIRGRLFTDQDTEHSPRVAVINQKFAEQFFPSEDPIGQTLETPAGSRPRVEEPRTVVGIVGNFISHVRAGPQAHVFVPYRQFTREFNWYTLNQGFILRTEADPMSLAQPVREAVTATDPTMAALDIETMETRLGEASESLRQHFYVRLLSTLAAVAVFLAAVGLFGVTWYSVAQRAREFGLRKALGAQRIDILRSVLKEGLIIGVIGLGIGIPASLGLTRLIENQLYGIDATDPVTFIAVAAALLVVVLVAAYVPGQRAANVEPMEALRHE